MIVRRKITTLNKGPHWKISWYECLLMFSSTFERFQLPMGPKQGKSCSKVSIVTKNYRKKSRNHLILSLFWFDSSIKRLSIINRLTFLMDPHLYQSPITNKHLQALYHQVSSRHIFPSSDIWLSLTNVSIYPFINQFIMQLHLKTSNEVRIKEVAVEKKRRKKNLR